MITIENLSFVYNGADQPSLRNVNLQIDDGDFVLVTGPSGGGKSSLCRCLNGLIPHFYGGKISGEVNVGGTDVLQQSPKHMAATVGMVFQDPENQLVAMDVEREIAFGLENLAFPVDLIAKRVEESLDTLGIADLRFRSVHELSGGEKQKVAIAAVLALHPSILVLDEPTSELDPKGAEGVLAALQLLNDEFGLTVILVEHRLDRVVHLVDRMVAIREGEIVADGAPRQVLSSQVMKNLGLGIPPIVRLVQELKGGSHDDGDIPLTVKEGRRALEGYFREAGSSQFYASSDSHSDPIIDVANLWHTYPNAVNALRGVTMSVNKGEFVAIMGRNASGKSTLVKHFNGLLKPAKGTVLVNGSDSRKFSVAELARTVGMAFQNPNDHLFADTVEGEISITLRHHGFRDGALSDSIERALALFDLEKHRRSYPRSLSGGERQRVALASVIAPHPEVLVLDEPTRGMDQSLKDELMTFLIRHTQQGNAVILISHDVEMVAEHADRVVLLSEGKIIVDGPTRNVLSRALLFSPQINRLVQPFEKYGVPPDILTVGEALDLLK
ncbi:MAG: energy-coupling factor transporter ATPase [Chloroflexota bacterium]|nr:energy-coupling factor transporter ATPase [Chloroflexota bacterium]